MPRTTSVYLSDEILEGLAATGLTPIQAIRAGIAARTQTVERQLLKAVASEILTIRNAIICDCLGAPRGHMAGSTPACSGGTSDASLRRQIGEQLSGITGSDDTRQIGRPFCKRCLHEQHGGECVNGCEQCKRTIEASAFLPAYGASCSDQCDHRAGKHIPAAQLPAGHALTEHVMTPEDTAGITEPVEYYAVCGYGCDERTQAQECPVHGWSEVR